MAKQEGRQKCHFSRHATPAAESFPNEDNNNSKGLASSPLKALLRSLAVALTEESKRLLPVLLPAAELRERFQFAVTARCTGGGHGSVSNREIIGNNNAQSDSALPAVGLLAPFAWQPPAVLLKERLPNQLPQR